MMDSKQIMKALFLLLLTFNLHAQLSFDLSNIPPEEKIALQTFQHDLAHLLQSAFQITNVEEQIIFRDKGSHVCPESVQPKFGYKGPEVWRRWYFEANDGSNLRFMIESVKSTAVKNHMNVYFIFYTDQVLTSNFKRLFLEWAECFSDQKTWWIRRNGYEVTRKIGNLKVNFRLSRLEKRSALAEGKLRKSRWLELP